MPSDDLFSFTTPFDFNGIQDGYTTLLDEDCDMEQEATTLKGKQLQDQIFSMDDLELEEINNRLPELGGATSQHDQQHQHSSSHENPTKLKNIIQSSSSTQEFVNHNSFALSTLGLLTNYASGSKKLKATNDHETNINTRDSRRQKLSTEEIMRVAGTRYIQYFSDHQGFHDFSMVMHPFGYALSGLSEEETRDVELVHLLLSAAEKVGYQQYERASRLLSRCDWIAAERANSAQRVVYYFAEALRGRIDKETVRITFAAEEATVETTLIDQGKGYNISTLKCYQKIPFNQVLYYAAIQSILENDANASKIHVIDFEIRSGVQWTDFMQALAERVVQRRPIQLFKITAVGLRIQERVLEEVGKTLSGLAESLSIPFAFNIVCVSSFIEIKQELFSIRNDESLVVYCSLILRTLLSWPSCLENLLGVIKKLNPSIMVVLEIEANHNSPSFVNRFTEALFFYSAFFDSLETCFEQDIGSRTEIEEVLNKGIHNIVAMEGSDRTVRSVKIDVWRAFFARYRMVEIGFSDTCLYQANLLIKKFACAGCCSFDKNVKSLVIGWKGTPMHSLSVWKFSREIRGRLFLNNRFSNDHN
ncbi:hypothetical protein Ddye_017161 [Dipteronia dyeriana]|uniref:DELLA RGL1-like protein n=1 Tax=Dipteronia dyeriana TaxID=168575 RepID=A0AAD9U864_9ROSI|nr:hypothetical protein Ddye_017161 [Dipteronia dyeriana]